MKRTVVIIVEGGRIQDIYADSTDIRVVVKNFDDSDDVTPRVHPAREWPLQVIATNEIDPTVNRSA